MAHTRNLELAAVIAEARLSHAQVAAAMTRIAAEAGAQELVGIGRSHVTHWVAGSRPSGRGPAILAETLSRALGRLVTLGEIGLGDTSPNLLDWGQDTLTSLADLGRVDVDADRRRILGSAAYSIAALTVPGSEWWEEMLQRGRARQASSRLVGAQDLEAVQDMVALFSRVDQRRGGGHARTAVVQYLTADVAGYLRGSFADDRVRREMFSAAAELAYLSGWMSFDASEHAIAGHYFQTALKLAAEGDDAPMAAHVLRAMAHQALDLGHFTHALHLAEASTAGRRYAAACPRERALLGVVHARALAAAGRRDAASSALLRAEDDLSAAGVGGEEPGRVFFFGEASLAHETAAALRDMGDLTGAVRQFRHSVRTRKATSFTRTHAVTLGYLGSVQASMHNLEEACATWSASLDAMNGVRSGRTRQVALTMRATLSPFRRRGIRAVAEVDARAAAYLSTGAGSLVER